MMAGFALALRAAVVLSLSGTDGLRPLPLPHSRLARRPTATTRLWLTPPPANTIPKKSRHRISFLASKKASISSTGCHHRDFFPRLRSSATGNQGKEEEEEEEANVSSTTSSILTSSWRPYLELIRPVTLVQAVGALVVGALVATYDRNFPSPTAALSVYLSYGSGMAANDCVDETTDALHDGIKKDRPIPSGRITVKQGWAFTALLAATSVALAYSTGSQGYTLWTISNLMLMFLYALGLQKVFLIKNVIVGYLGVSPLLGSTLVPSAVEGTSTPSSVVTLGRSGTTALYRLAGIGLAVGVSREILKDIEDVDVDRIAGKMTLPHVVGVTASHRIAFALVAIACVACWTSGYRHLFSSPLYIGATMLGTAMCARASFLDVPTGQRLLKKSVYVLLMGMIGSLVLSPN